MRHNIRLSSKGQLTIPKAVRDTHQWHEGDELMLIDSPSGILIQSPRHFPKTTLDQVAGSLHYDGPRISLEAMDEAVGNGLAKQSA